MVSYSSLARYLAAGLLAVALTAGFAFAQISSQSDPYLSPEAITKGSLAPGFREAVSNRDGEKFTFQNLGFIENRGQQYARVTYYWQGRGEGLFFTREGVCLVLAAEAPPGAAGAREKAKGNQAAVVHLKPVGMRPGVEVVPESPLPGKVSYYRGNDPAQWRTGVSTYGAVRYREAYPGIDLKFYQSSGGGLEYDVIVKPGADPGLVKFAYEGAAALKVKNTGDLAVRLPDGRELLQKKPLVYQEVAGQRVLREGKFRVSGEKARLTYSFEVAAYDPRHPLVIDPILAYSTYLGGTAWDLAYAITVDAYGCAVVTGWRTSQDFPVNGWLMPPPDAEVYVVKFTASGQLYYTAFFGGYNMEWGTAVTTDRFGNAYVTGYTESLNFPLLYPPGNRIVHWVPSSPDFANSFVIKLDEFGDLVYSIYLGGEKRDYANSIAVDAVGGAYVAGYTASPDFPYSGWFQQKTLHPYKGNGDGFIAYIPPNCKAQPDMTFLGGTGEDSIMSLALDSLGNLYVTGNTTSTNFPVKFAAFGTPRGKKDGFVAKINTGFKGLAYSTYLGGSEDDESRSLALLNGNVYVAGWTASSNFPRKNGLFGFGGKGDAFVARFNPYGALLYSTFLGGSNIEGARGIAVDPSGNMYVVGSTCSDNFPLKNPVKVPLTTRAEPNIIIVDTYRAFVTKFNAAGNALVYSTKLGGTDGAESGYGIAVDRAGSAYVAGTTSSHDFPVKKAAQPYNFGYLPGFVTKLWGN